MRERRLIAETITDNIGLELESHMREFICDAIFNSLRLTEERCKMFFQEQLEKKRNLNEIKRHHAHMEDYLHQSFRQRNIQLCNELSEFDAITMTEPHVIAIRRNATLLKENLDLEGTLLLDRLMGNDVLSEAGRKSILSRKTRVGQNCAFLDHVTKTFNANSFKTVFLPALQKEHESLSNELEKDLDLPNASFPAVRRCQSCEVKSKISIRKFANHLHQSGIIDEALCSELVLSERPHDERWKLIVKKLKKNKRDVMSALRTFHEQCYQMLKTTKSSLFHCFCDELDTQKSDVTRTVDTGSGEPDVARMSDFSSEVDSIASPTLYFDRRHQNVSDITNAPYPFTCWDRDIFSPSLSSALNDKASGKDENIPYFHGGMPTRDDLRTSGLRFVKNRKRYSPLSSPTVTPFSKYENSGRDENLPIAHGEMKTRGYLHERTFGFANDSTEAWHHRRSLRRFFLRTRSLRSNQLQHEGDTTKAPSSTSSFSPLSSPPQSPLSVPEFEGRDENLPYVHGEMKTRGYLHERTFGFANDSTEAWHRRRSLRRFVLPTRSLRSNQLQHEGDTTKAPSSISCFSPLSSPPQSPLSVPEFEDD